MIRFLQGIAPIAILALFFQACAAWQAQPSAPTVETACEGFFHEMDLRVAEQGAADAGTARVQDFPHLRADRFLASFANENLTNQAYAAWIERLRKLDETARLIEWRNLPAEAASGLALPIEHDVESAVKSCGQRLAEQDRNSQNRRAKLLANVEPPDAYSIWQRVLGLYPLTRWAIVKGVWQVQREMREPFINDSPELPITEKLIRYAPPSSEIMKNTEVAAILEQSAANPLAIPEPSADRLARLFDSFAPIWVVDTASDNDRIGTVRIDADRKAYVDTQQPIVYRLASHTRFDKQVLLQLNYLIWFPARPPTGLTDIYAGRFDGLIWRVTLGMDGKPLAYDSIHPCGCYYQIFPGEGRRVVQPQDGSEPILSPKPITGVKPGERLTIRLGSTTHFIRAIQSEQPAPESKAYAWLDYDDLLSLPMPNGRHRSLFDANGLVPDSERPERFLLWPMGVPSAGAMRQWGTHAVAFLGKRHFDDPRLLEKLIRPLWE